MQLIDEHPVHINQSEMLANMPVVHKNDKMDMNGNVVDNNIQDHKYEIVVGKLQRSQGKCGGQVSECGNKGCGQENGEEVRSREQVKANDVCQLPNNTIYKRQEVENSKESQIDDAPMFTRHHPLINVKKLRPDSCVSRDCRTQINELKVLKAQWEADKQLLIQEDLMTRDIIKAQPRHRRNLKEHDQTSRRTSYHKKQINRYNKADDDGRSSASRSIKNSNSRVKNDNKSGFSGFMIAPHQLSKKSSKVNSNASNNGSNDDESSIYRQYKSKNNADSSFYEQISRNRDSHKRHSSKNRETRRYLHNQYATIDYSALSSHNNVGTSIQNHNGQTNRNSSKNSSQISKSKKKSFILTTRNHNPLQTSKNSQQQSFSISKQSTARAHIKLLNQKVKQMQKKLSEIQKTQKILQQQPHNQKPVNNNEQQQEKHNISQKLEQEDVAKQQAQNVVMLNNFKKKNTLNISSSIVNYNYSEEQNKKQHNEEEERIRLKQQMQSQIQQLKHTIRELKLERIRREAILAEIDEKKQKANKVEKIKQEEKNKVKGQSIRQKTLIEEQNRYERETDKNILEEYHEQGEQSEINCKIGPHYFNKKVIPQRKGIIIKANKNQQVISNRKDDSDFLPNTHTNIKQPQITYKIENIHPHKKQNKNSSKMKEEIDSPIQIQQHNPQQKDNKSVTISRISATLPTRKGIIIRQMVSRVNESKVTERKSNYHSQNSQKYLSQDGSRLSNNMHSNNNSFNSKLRQKYSFNDQCHKTQSNFAEPIEQKQQMSTKQLNFIPIQQYKHIHEQIQLPKYQIPSVQMPKQFLIPTFITQKKLQYSYSTKQLLNLAKNICTEFGVTFKCQENNISTQICLKKYKNCIIFATPDPQITIVWHYSGKFYIGGWHQQKDISIHEEGEGSSDKSLKHGDGFEYIPNKFYYKGSFLNGKKHGKGVMITVQGDIYSGQWDNGDKSGKGVFYQKSTGMIYEGQWKLGKKQGQGVLKVSDSQFYKGQFEKNLKHGQGFQLFSNGDIYEGNHENGLFEGKGKYFWKNGSAFDGNFSKGKRNGFGKWRAAKIGGDYYQGNYEDEKKHGKGIYIWENGCQYSGQFKSDYKHGEGSILYADGRQIKGVWEIGKLSGIYQNSNKYQPVKQSSSQIDGESISASVQQQVNNLKQTPYKATQMTSNLLQV